MDLVSKVYDELLMTCKYLLCNYLNYCLNFYENFNINNILLQPYFKNIFFACSNEKNPINLKRKTFFVLIPKLDLE